MKRKRRSAKCTPNKPSAADAPLDPGYYSDVNKHNDELHANKEIETLEMNTDKSVKRVDSHKAVVNNETPRRAATKLARALSSSRTNAATDKVTLHHQTIGQKEPKSSRSAPVYNKQELEAALSVIKKIMKMDAAMAFLAPVDPIALGIPDYFDIIHTPMDFGTICGKLEKGLEYKNSEDVFQDVQLIWDNCAKYNKKGSTILEHMKRVKANFMKQWNAAGLYKEQQTVSKGHLPHDTQTFADSTMISEEDVPTSPVASSIRESAYLPRHNSACLSQGKHQQFPPCCSSHTFIPQHMPYQYSSSLHPGMHYPGVHHHDMVPHHGHSTHLPLQRSQYSHLQPMDSINVNPYNTHLYPMDSINANPYNPWANEASASVMHSHHPSASGSVMGHPQQRTYLHPSSSTQLPPSRVHPDINSQSPGHMLLPHREPTSTFNQHEHAYHLPQHDGDRNHLQRYQIDSVPPPSYHPSTSCVPAHQPNQSNYHQLQSSHIEGRRNIERAGNLSTPPPVESTMNFSTKRDTEHPRPTFVDNTSYHQPEKRNSTPEQSSSMNILEACELPENADQNQAEPSPSERLHSTADSSISKRKSQIPEHPHIQESSPPMRIRKEHPPVENAPKNQIAPLQSPMNQAAPTQSPMNQIAPSQSPTSLQSRPLPLGTDDSMRIKTKHRGRGPAKGMFRQIERISVATDDYGQPIGPEGQKLASFLGTLARNGNFLPLTYHDWRAVPQEYKESMWEKIQLGFDIDPKSKDWVLRSLSHKWKNWKSMLKTSRYDPHETDEERLADLDERVLPEQWAALVAVWGTEAAQKRSKKNKASRAAMKFNHATGRKSFARLRAEQRAKRPEGKELSRAELFILTRTRKDGQPVNPETSQVIEKLKEREQGQDTPEEGKKPDDILAEIIGPNYKGAPRCVELGSSMTGQMKPSRAEAIVMVSQADTEMHEMKEKMAFMEQTCAQMASQMAAMMSMMSSMNKNVPDMVLITSATSDQSTPHQVNALPSPPADPTPQVPATSGTSDQSTPHEEKTMPPPPVDLKPQARPRGRPRKR